MRLVILIGALLAAGPGFAGDAGRLVIVGGGLERDNVAVFRTFLDGVGATAPIAVIGAASSSPVRSVQRFADDLAHYGVSPERVTPIRLAWLDDESTATDESTWRGNASNPQEIARLEAAGAVWFTGGDQSRIVRVLRHADGSATPMLETLRARLAAGIVVGGSSAGAAVMSDPMISGGANLPVLLSGLKRLRAGDASLPLPQPPTVADTSVLSMGSGLGFLPGVLVDQHFGARARLGRLVMALLARPRAERIGIGIDENTGIGVDLASGQIEMLGAAGVTLVDAGDASIAAGTIRGVRVSLLPPGARLAPSSLTVTMPDGLEPIRHEGRDAGDVIGSTAGVAAPGAGLAERLREDLGGNGTAGSVEYVTLQHDGGAVGSHRGVVYRFSRTPASRLYRSAEDTGVSRFALLDLGFDIEPVRVVIEPAPAPSD
jgi:cyanophycinase